MWADKNKPVSSIDQHWPISTCSQNPPAAILAPLTGTGPGGPLVQEALSPLDGAQTNTHTKGSLGSRFGAEL